jgi:hypothetical protein
MNTLFPKIVRRHYLSSCQALRHTGIVAAGFFMVTLCQIRAASVAFSTFGPGDSFVPSAGEGISGPSGQLGEVDKAMVFAVTGTSWLLTQVEFPYTDLNGINTVELTIRQDVGGSPSAIVLESVTFPVPNTLASIVTVSLSGMTQVDPGITYWLALSMPDNGAGSWLFTSPPVFGPRARSTDGGTSWTIASMHQSAFRLTGIPIPEPSPAALLVGALLVLRRHRASQVPQARKCPDLFRLASAHRLASAQTSSGSQVPQARKCPDLLARLPTSAGFASWRML